MRQGRSPFRHVDPWVFFPAAAVCLAFVLWGVLDVDSVGNVADDALGWVIETFGWVFVLSTFLFLGLAIYLGVSRHGKVRLGADDEKPEFRTASWIAMMFSAGMGIGLMFFGVAEPLSHLSAPPNNAAPAGSPEAARVAMEYSYFHWAFHPWAIYAIVGLALAYFVFRKGQRNLISTAFRPILGDRVDGPIGRGIDSLAIFATLFGSATSLGLGALQINGGMNILWDVQISDGIAVAIIAVLTAAFVLSAVSGVHKGIQWLSNTNMVLAGLLLLFILIVGPTIFIFDTLTEAVGGYLTSIVPNSFRTGAFGDREWLGSWTIFYWAWWISWAPFVGTFIARISRGRTIGEFVLGVLLIPSGVSFVWFAVLGGAALDLQLTGAGRHRRGRGHEPGAGAVHDARAVRAVGHHVVRRDRARRAVLRQRRGRGLGRDGDAVVPRRAQPAAQRRDPVGDADGRVRLGAAARGRPRGAPAGRDPRRRAVPARDDRAGGEPLEGAARRRDAGRRGRARAGAAATGGDARRLAASLRRP